MVKNHKKDVDNLLVGVDKLFVRNTKNAAITCKLENSGEKRNVDNCIFSSLFCF